jgi:hypothetical protein
MHEFARFHASSTEVVPDLPGLPDTTYRGIVKILKASESLRGRLGLVRLPHYLMLKRLVERLEMTGIIDTLIDYVLHEVSVRPDEAAMDSTDVETPSANAHYRREAVRIAKVREGFAGGICGSMLAGQYQHHGYMLNVYVYRL